MHKDGQQDVCTVNIVCNKRIQMQKLPAAFLDKC